MASYDEIADMMAGLRTSDVTLLSHAHGRERRGQRGISRRELQEAIKYGRAERANPGRAGDARWRFTHKGVVYITDETMRHEITSWRLDCGGVGEAAVDEAALDDAGRCDTGAHVVLVVDHSGSMRKADVPGYETRTAAVYDCLACDFVEAQLRAGGAHLGHVSVTLIEMADEARVIFQNKELDAHLADELRGRGSSRAQSHGNYLPTLDVVLQQFAEQASRTAKQLFLVFLSDGEPSDHGTLPCLDHGVQVWQPAVDLPEFWQTYRTRRDGRPPLQDCLGSRRCRARLKKSVEMDCVRKVQLLGDLFGRDRVFVNMIAFGKPDENYRVLRAMAEALPRHSFQKLGLSAEGLRTAFSTLTSSLTSMRTDCCGVSKTEREVREQTAEEGRKALARLALDVDEWDIYRDGRLRFKTGWDAGRKGLVPKALFVDGRCAATGIAHAKRFFAKGAERFAFHATEVFGDDTYGGSRPVGPTLVAKMSKHVELQFDDAFHVTFCRMASEADEMARLFNRRVAGGNQVCDDFFVAFVQPFVYTVVDANYGGRVSFLVEPELVGRFIKWNNNAGGVLNETAADRGQQQRAARAAAASLLNTTTIEEGSEDDDDDDDDAAPAPSGPTPLDVPQALSHFSFSRSQGRTLLCDIQGTWNAVDGFLLTDPVILTRLGKRKNGATDKGEDGIRRFFETHECNALCRRLGLGREPGGLLPP